MNSKLCIGLNTLQNVFKEGLEINKCDEVIVSAFNVNLNYVLTLFRKYPDLKKFKIYANDEYIKYSSINTEEILSYFKEGKIELNHISANKYIIHSKAYSFFKNNECKLMAIGSPNLTRKSNQNIESAVIFSNIENDEDILKIWEKLEELSEELKIKEAEPRAFIFSNQQETFENINEDLLTNLWEHQKLIVKWLTQRPRSIVNIPPGVGKTKIGLTYLEYLKMNNEFISTIILVPTKTLLEQWASILNNKGFRVLIGESRRESLNQYLARPEGTILLTLYRRFFSYYEIIANKLKNLSTQLFLMADECHNIYSKFMDLQSFTEYFENKNYYHLGLSATIDTFEAQKKEDYINYCGGTYNVFDISLQSFYSNWNDKNDRPILKNLEYIPSFYYLTEEEFRKYNDLSRKVFLEKKYQNINGDNNFNAALMRANYVRSRTGAIDVLQSALDDNMSELNDGSAIIFVYTNEIAQRIQERVTSNENWNPESSAYIYDSHQISNYLDYAINQFRSHHGFCLISERMLAEGFDLPKVTHVVLHGSHRSERDWIQKIGRAIRYDPETPETIAKIIDVVFCDPRGMVLPIEKERYEILSSLSN